MAWCLQANVHARTDIVKGSPFPLPPSHHEFALALFSYLALPYPVCHWPSSVLLCLFTYPPRAFQHLLSNAAQFTALLIMFSFSRLLHFYLFLRQPSCFTLMFGSNQGKWWKVMQGTLLLHLWRRMIGLTIEDKLSQHDELSIVAIFSEEK